MAYDLIQIRVIIDPAVAALAAQCATRQDIAELEAILDKMGDPQTGGLRPAGC